VKMPWLGFVVASKSASIFSPLIRPPSCKASLSPADVTLVQCGEDLFA